MNVKGVEDKQSKMYEVTVECTNCGYTGIAKITRNVSVATARCIECGCYGLQRRAKDEGGL